MATLKTLLIAMNTALMATALFTPPAPAQDTDAEPERFTNRDLMNWPEDRRREWVNALMIGSTNAFGLHDPETGRCVAHWYFNDQQRTLQQITSNLEAHPDALPVIVIFALAKRSCPGISPSN